jgi:hypothetical protein
MSLKFVHLIFITVATLLALLFAGWCAREYMAQKRDIYIGMGGSSFLAAIALIVYGVRFAKKIKTLK